MNILGRVLIISVVTVGVSFATQSFAQTFTYTQIDAPNSSGSSPNASNSFGQMVEVTEDADGTLHSFLRFTDGTYFKFDYPGASFTGANGINDHGVIVGRWTDSQGKNHTFLRSPSGDFSNFDPPAPCFPSNDPTSAHRINHYGDIVGRCFSPNHHEYGWILHHDGTFQILTGSSFASSDGWFAPNGSQYIAGGDYTEGTHRTGEGIAWRAGFVHGVLWNRNGGFT